MHWYKNTFAIIASCLFVIHHTISYIFIFTPFININTTIDHCRRVLIQPSHLCDYVSQINNFLDTPWVDIRYKSCPAVPVYILWSKCSLSSVKAPAPSCCSPAWPALEQYTEQSHYTTHSSVTYPSHFLCAHKLSPCSRPHSPHTPPSKLGARLAWALSGGKPVITHPPTDCQTRVLHFLSNF